MEYSGHSTFLVNLFLSFFFHLNPLSSNRHINALTDAKLKTLHDYKRYDCCEIYVGITFFMIRKMNGFSAYCS